MSVSFAAPMTMRLSLFALLAATGALARRGWRPEASLLFEGNEAEEGGELSLRTARIQREMSEAEHGVRAVLRGHPEELHRVGRLLHLASQMAARAGESQRRAQGARERLAELSQQQEEQSLEQEPALAVNASSGGQTAPAVAAEDERTALARFADGISGVAAEDGHLLAETLEAQMDVRRALGGDGRQIERALAKARAAQQRIVAGERLEERDARSELERLGGPADAAQDTVPGANGRREPAQEASAAPPQAMGAELPEAQADVDRAPGGGDGQLERLLSRVRAARQKIAATGHREAVQHSMPESAIPREVAQEASTVTPQPMGADMWEAQADVHRAPFGDDGQLDRLLSRVQAARRKIAASGHRGAQDARRESEEQPARAADAVQGSEPTAAGPSAQAQAASTAPPQPMGAEPLEEPVLAGRSESAGADAPVLAGRSESAEADAPAPRAQLLSAKLRRARAALGEHIRFASHQARLSKRGRRLLARMRELGEEVAGALRGGDAVDAHAAEAFSRHMASAQHIVRGLSAFHSRLARRAQHQARQLVRFARRLQHHTTQVRHVHVTQVAAGAVSPQPPHGVDAAERAAAKVRGGHRLLVETARAEAAVERALRGGGEAGEVREQVTDLLQRAELAEEDAVASASASLRRTAGVH